MKFENLTTRVIVAIIAIPLIILTTLLGGYFFFALITLISSFALYEFYNLAEIKGAKPLKLLGIITGILINCIFISQRIQSDFFILVLGGDLSTQYLYPQFQMFVIIMLEFVLIALIIELFRKEGSPIINLGTTITGVIVISLFLSTLIELRESFEFGFSAYKFFESYLPDNEQIEQMNKWGGWTIVAIFASIWMCDTAAYFGGVKLGKHKLFKRVSPKKSWEGAVFGFIFAVLTMLVMKFFALDYLSFFDSVAIGALIGIFAQIGDLVESRLKRDAGVKDSSAIIPGHGGIYDRFDSLIYISPIVYLYINFIVLK